MRSVCEVGAANRFLGIGCDLPTALLANREAIVDVLLPIEELKLDVGTSSSSSK